MDFGTFGGAVPRPLNPNVYLQDPQEKAYESAKANYPFGEIRDSLNANVFLINEIPALLQPHEAPVVRNLPTGKVTLREPLLGFHGMDRFDASSIYQKVERLPPFLQDFSYTFQRGAVRSAYDDDAEEKVTSNPVLELIPDGEMTLTMRSQKTFQQEDKELESVDVEFPRLKVYQQTTAYSELIPEGDIDTTLFDDVTQGYAGVAGTHLQRYSFREGLRIQSYDPLPDFMFIYLEFDQSNYIPLKVIGEESGEEAYSIRGGSDKKWIDLPITKLKLSILGQDLKSVNALATNELIELTMRNSHYYADELLHVHDGAVLLTREDLADYNYFIGDNGRDALDLEVNCEFIYTQLVSNVAKFASQTRPDVRIKAVLINKENALRGAPHHAEFSYK